MAAKLIRTTAAVEDCRRHLDATESLGTEIESYLTQYLLVVLCAEVQQELYRIVSERAALANDAALSSFVVASCQRVLRSVGKKEIATFVEMFGPDCKRRLNDIIEDSEVTAYNNAVSSRHDVAHKQGSQVTFAEMRKAVAAAEKLLSATTTAIAHVSAQS